MPVTSETLERTLALSSCCHRDLSQHRSNFAITFPQIHPIGSTTGTFREGSNHAAFKSRISSGTCSAWSSTISIYWQICSNLWTYIYKHNLCYTTIPSYIKTNILKTRNANNGNQLPRLTSPYWSSGTQDGGLQLWGASQKKSIHVMMEIWGKNFEITNNHQIMKKQHPKNHWTLDPGGFEPLWVGVFWGLQNDATCDLSGFLGQKDIGSQKFLRKVSQGILTSICLIFTVDPIGFRIITTFKHRPQKIPWAWAGHGATALTFRAISFFQQTPVITQHGADDVFHHPKNEENHGFQWG